MSVVRSESDIGHDDQKVTDEEVARLEQLLNESLVFSRRDSLRIENNGSIF